MQTIYPGKKVHAVLYWLSHFGVSLVLKCTGDNTEKIWVHQIFPKQKQTCQRHVKWQLEVWEML